MRAKALDQGELLKLKKLDIQTFSHNAAQDADFKKFFTDRGITDIQGWVSKRLAPGDYYIDKTLPASFYSRGTRAITFCSTEEALCPFTRAHENAHKAGRKYIYNGLETYFFGGYAITEGVTNLIAEKLSGEEADGYETETGFARKLVEILGWSIVLEGYFFRNSALAKEFNGLAGEQYAYSKFIRATDKCFILFDEANIWEEQFERLKWHDEVQAIFENLENNKAKRLQSFFRRNTLGANVQALSMQ